MSKGPAPPESAGGLGPWYEAQVIASNLAELLTEGTILGVDASIPSEVALQQRATGHPLDDLVIIGSTVGGDRIKLDLQIKHRLAATKPYPCRFERTVPCVGLQVF